MGDRIGCLFRQCHVAVPGSRYHGENGGGVAEVLVEGPEIRTSILVIVQVTKVMRVAIVGILDCIRINGVVVTCSSRK